MVMPICQQAVPTASSPIRSCHVFRKCPIAGECFLHPLIRTIFTVQRRPTDLGRIIPTRLSCFARNVLSFTFFFLLHSNPPRQYIYFRDGFTLSETHRTCQIWQSAITVWNNMVFIFLLYLAVLFYEVIYMQKLYLFPCTLISL